MKTTLLSLMALALMGASQAQTRNTLIMKPGANCGFDAVIRTNTVAALNWDNTNYGNSPEIDAVAWTWYASGGGPGTVRSLINFRDLSLIPTGATVVSATLRLYAVPAPSIANSGTNDCWVQRVTSTWTETGVTWTNQPTATATNQVAIPGSTSTTYNVALNVTAMVQDMVNLTPTNRFGFRILLQTEATYRSMVFASSDHATAALWPELEVVYEYQCALPRPDAPVGNMEQADAINTDRGLEIFPNPSTGLVTLNFYSAVESEATIGVTDMKGQTVKQFSLTTVKGENRYQADLSGMATGNYNVNIRFANPALAPLAKGVVVK